MTKYDALGEFLVSIRRSEVRLSFSNIEEIIGFQLPRSAYTYPAWWANGGNSQAEAWMNVGYMTRDLDIPNESVTFCKEGVVT